MFRVQNNVPEVYPDKSRDFQLFCRLYDVAFNSVKNSADSLQNVTSTLLCESSLLELLKDKLGFFSTVDVDDTELRYILQAFPAIIRYKGSRRAIDYILNLYSRLIVSHSRSNNVVIRSIDTEYVVSVVSETPIKKTPLLLELLRYVLPSGFIIDYNIALLHSSNLDLGVSTELYYNVVSDDSDLKTEPAVKTQIVIYQDVDNKLDNAEQPRYPWIESLHHILNIAKVGDSSLEGVVGDKPPVDTSKESTLLGYSRLANTPLHVEEQYRGTLDNFILDVSVLSKYHDSAILDEGVLDGIKLAAHDSCILGKGILDKIKLADEENSSESL